MIWPLLAVGALAWFFGRESARTTVGRALPAAAQTRGKARFQLGVPYAITARTAPLSQSERARLYSLLTFGTYHARNITWTRRGSDTGGHELVSLDFRAPKTSVVPLGQPLDWDLGDGRVRLILTSVRRLPS